MSQSEVVSVRLTPEVKTKLDALAISTMTQTLPKLVTFEDFIEWYPSDGVRYELLFH